MKIYVYAICKNEEKFVTRWVNSMNEADGIYVLDTGSTDNTVNLLKSLNVYVKQEVISPWRFDVARNKSLELVPEDADLCVCTDLDEVFEKGWRKKMEKVLTEEVTVISYRYTWNFNPDGSEGYVFWISKAHRRNGYKWEHPVHEVLKCDKNEVCIEAEGVQLNHYADNTKSRSQYLPLLELSVKENPDDDRNVHYLGREYMFYGKWKECEETLKRHLSLPSATWKDERSASMRFIAKAVINQGRTEEGYQWLLKALTEAPYLREAYVDLAELEQSRNNFAGAFYFAEKALSITQRSKSYINEADNWGYKPYDICAVSCYYLGLFDKAYFYGEKAYSCDKTNQRLRDNLAFYKQKIKNVSDTKNR